MKKKKIMTTVCHFGDSIKYDLNSLFAFLLIHFLLRDFLSWQMYADFNETPANAFQAENDNYADQLNADGLGIDHTTTDTSVNNFTSTDDESTRQGL